MQPISVTPSEEGAKPVRRTAGVIAPPPLLFLGALALGLLVDSVVPAPLIPGGSHVWFRALVGGVFIAAGAVLVLAAKKRFGRAGTPARPWKPSSALVTDGPFVFTRNPMYLAMTAIYFGLCVVIGSFWGLVMLVPLLVLVDRAVIQREERYLTGLFGEPYTAYCKRVRRWL